MTQKERQIANAAKRRIEEDPLVELAAKDYLTQLVTTRNLITEVMVATEDELGVQLKRTKGGKFALNHDGEVIMIEGDAKDFWKLATEKQEALFEDYPLTNKSTTELIEIFMTQRKCPYYRHADVERKILELFAQLNPDKTVADIKKEINPFEIDHISAIADIKAKVDQELKEMGSLQENIVE